jgi:hypothetical protein
VLRDLNLLEPHGSALDQLLPVVLVVEARRYDGNQRHRSRDDRTTVCLRPGRRL